MDTNSRTFFKKLTKLMQEHAASICIVNGSDRTFMEFKVNGTVFELDHTCLINFQTNSLREKVFINDVKDYGEE